MCRTTLSLRHLLHVLLGISVAGCLSAAESAPAIKVSQIARPETAAAVAPSLATAPDGTLWMAWVAIAGKSSSPVAMPHALDRGDGNTLRVAAFDTSRQAWETARTLATGRTVSANPADYPQLAIDGAGNPLALWTDGHGGAYVAPSQDRGLTWSEPKPWTTHSRDVEKFSLGRLADGRVLVVWLDGRGRHGDTDRQKLYARIAGEPEEQEWLVDPSVCDCCQTSLLPFPDGGAVVAYRGRTADEVRDVRTARFRDGRWQAPRVLNHDGWRINGCPVNGPRLAGDGSRVAAAWFTGAGNDPRVLVSFSPDAGQRWLMPLRVDHGHPAGHVDLVLLRDGAEVVTWLEADGSLWLRRISPDFTADDPVVLAAAGTASPAGFPRVALASDYAGNRTAARLIVAYTSETSRVTTLAVTVPEGDFLTTERHCDCAPTPEQLEGYPVRGTIVSADPRALTLRVQHDEVPGVLPSGEHSFTISTLLMPGIETGRPLLARIARRGSHWELLDIRYLGEPAAEKPGGR